MTDPLPPIPPVHRKDRAVTAATRTVAGGPFHGKGPSRERCIDLTSMPDPATASIKDRRKDSLLRVKAIQARTGLSVATIYRREKEGSFPKRTAIGRGCVGWYESDIEDFVANPFNYRRP